MHAHRSTLDVLQVRTAKAADIAFVLHVIGFDIADSDTMLLECAAQAGNGLYLGAAKPSTHTRDGSNPRAFEILLGTNRVHIKTMDGEMGELRAQVEADTTTELWLELPTQNATQ